MRKDSMPIAKLVLGWCGVANTKLGMLIIDGSIAQIAAGKLLDALASKYGLLRFPGVNNVEIEPDINLRHRVLLIISARMHHQEEQ